MPKYLNNTGAEYLVGKVQDAIEDAKYTPSVYISSFINYSGGCARIWNNGWVEMWGAATLPSGSTTRVNTIYYADCRLPDSTSSSYSVQITLSTNGSIATSYGCFDRGGNRGTYTDGFITSASTTGTNYTITYHYYAMYPCVPN